MSSRKERYQKDCLNCGAHVFGRFCHVCGQENVEPSTSAWNLLFHFLADFLHFDGKFFKTLGTLFLRPGKIPFEFRAGKRKKYLDPARMYIFSSAVFFLFLFNVVDVKRDSKLLQEKDLRSEVISLLPPDSLRRVAVKLGLPPDADAAKVSARADSMRFRLGVILEGRRYNSGKEYDSAISAGTVKHDRMTRWLTHKQFELKEKYQSLSLAILDILDHWIHTFPQVFFVSLPLFAFLLKLAYLRRKDLYYSDHLVFSTYLYIVFFALFAFFLIVGKYQNLLSETVAGWLKIFIPAFALIYEYKALRNCYRSSRARTMLNVLLIGILHFFLLVFLSALFLIFSIINL